MLAARYMIAAAAQCIKKERGGPSLVAGVVRGAVSGECGAEGSHTTGTR